MSDRETGVEEARKILGKLVDDAALDGTVTYLTRRGRCYAAIVPLDRIKESAMPITPHERPMQNLQYALCWEDPAGDEAWVVRCRPFPDPDNEGWDRWLFHPELGEDDEDAAKAWAAERFAGEGLTVDGWHRDDGGDLIPKFA